MRPPGPDRGFLPASGAPPAHLPAGGGDAYFILPGYTGQGLGAAMLQRLEEGARAMGIDTVLASISSHNDGSQRFHRRHGFVEARRFRRVGRKHG